MLNQVPSFTVETTEAPPEPLFGTAHGRLRASYPVLSPLYFHGLTNCFSRKPFALINICVAPRVSPPTVHDLQEFTSRTNQLFYRHTVMNSLSSRKKPSALESATSTLFHKNIRVAMGYAHLQNQRGLHQSVGRLE